MSATQLSQTFGGVQEAAIEFDLEPGLTPVPRGEALQLEANGEYGCLPATTN